MRGTAHRAAIGGHAATTVPAEAALFRHRMGVAPWRAPMLRNSRGHLVVPDACTYISWVCSHIR